MPAARKSMAMLICGAVIGMAPVALAKAASVGGGRSGGYASKIYSPARVSYTTGAAVKSSIPPKAKAAAAPSTASSLNSVPASSNQAVHESSGSFWTPFVLGYIMAPKSSSASESKQSKPQETSPQEHRGEMIANALSSGISNGVAQGKSPTADLQQKKGPFSIEIPEDEFFDAECHVKPPAQEFIKASKIERSVLFMSVPEKSRCSGDRKAVAGQIPGAILVKADDGKLRLSRLVGEP